MKRENARVLLQKILWFVVAAICATVAQFRMPQVPQKIFALGVMLGFSTGMLVNYVFDKGEKDGT